MLLPVLPFMTKSNLDLTLNLVSPLGFLGSLRVVILLLLPAMSHHSITPTLQPALKGNFFSVWGKRYLVSNDVWAEKERALGPMYQSGTEATEKRWVLVCVCVCMCMCVCEYTDSSGRTMRQTAWPPSCYLPSIINTLSVYCATPGGSSHVF